MKLRINAKWTIRENQMFLLNYDLPFPQIIRSDINEHYFLFSEFFDAIICDPPYGQRAFTRKSCLEKTKSRKGKKGLRKIIKIL